MTKQPYHLGPNGEPPIIKPHSLAKQDVLRSYLQAYFRTLTFSPGQETLKLTLVDGFAGWGRYTSLMNGDIVTGSPLIMLESTEKASAAINANRAKPLSFDVDYYFVEKDINAYTFLNSQLTNSDYGRMIGSKVQMLHSPFEKVAPGIIKNVQQKTPRSGRSIFLLDQYGYKDVDTKLINTILTTLPRSEVILTFNVDALLTFADNDKPLRLDKISLPDTLKGRSIQDIKESESDWRLWIQCALYPDLIAACGAKFYTLFYIRSPGGHGCYWLIHLSQHPIARDVMTCTHWDNYNYFVHYGGPGLNMLTAVGYDPGNDNRLFGFDDSAKIRCVEALQDQIPETIFRNSDGIKFGDLYLSTCNFTPATAGLYKEAIGNLIADKCLTVKGDSGTTRRSPMRIKDDDLLVVPRQPRLFY